MSVKREPFGGFVVIKNGTKEQYEKFYEAQKDAIIAKQMINKFGLEEVSRERWDAYREALEDSYKDWWHYFNPNIL